MNKEKLLKKITYTNPTGAKFIFIEDLKELLGKDKFKKWEEKSMGSNYLLVPNKSAGIYLWDVQKFIRLDEQEL